MRSAPPSNFLMPENLQFMTDSINDLIALAHKIIKIQIVLIRPSTVSLWLLISPLPERIEDVSLQEKMGKKGEVARG